MTDKRLGRDERRLQRQREAIDRQLIHSERSPEEQLVLLESRPGSSKRERENLMLHIEEVTT